MKTRLWWAIPRQRCGLTVQHAGEDISYSKHKSPRLEELAQAFRGELHMLDAGQTTANIMTFIISLAIAREDLLGDGQQGYPMTRVH